MHARQVNDVKGRQKRKKTAADSDSDGDDDASVSPARAHKKRKMPAAAAVAAPANRDRLPFWNDYTRQRSHELSLHQPIECVATDMSWSNGSSARQAHKAWFSVHSKQMQVPAWPLSSDLWNVIMTDAQQHIDRREGERADKQEKSRNRKASMLHAQQQKKQELLDIKEASRSEAANAVRKRKLPSDCSNNRQEEGKRTAQNPHGLKKPKPAADCHKRPAETVRKIRLYPTAKQWVKLKQARGVVRWTYNQCVRGVTRSSVPSELAVLRKQYVGKTEQGQLEHPWVYEVPYDLRDEGVKDFVQAHKACKTKVAKGDLAASGFHFKFRTAKDRTEKLVIHRKHWWAAGVFHPSFFGYEPFRSSEPLPDLLDYDTTLVIDRRLRHVELCLAAPLEVHPQATELAAARRQHPKIVAIDPGVRTFATCYDPAEQRIIEWGRNDMGTFYRMAKHADDLQRRFSSEIVGHRRRYRMRRAWVRMFAQVKNWSRDFHYRFAHWLCQNYDVILLPHYDISGMVRKGSRRIGAKTARAMLTWSPCTFRDRLLHVSRRYPGCVVVPLSEAYTSKTCRACGALHHELGGSRHFSCPTCDYQVSRDENGACNILLRYLTMLEEVVEKSPIAPSSPVVRMIDDLDVEDPIGVAENQGDIVPPQIDDPKPDSPECEVVAFHRYVGASLAAAPACMHELAKCNLSQNCELS